MEFKLFDNLHLIYLVGYFLFFYLLYLIVAYSNQPKNVMKYISFIILSIKCIELFFRYQIIGEAWYKLLPLHLCNITLILAILGSIFRIIPFLYATFFWSIGAIFALLTPELREIFPSFFNISFFSTHFYILFVSIVEYRIFKLRPTFESWFASFLGINLIMIAVYFINLVLGTNYFYINHKPIFSSPLDYLGVWPYYIIVVELLYIILTLAVLFLFKKKSYKLTTNL